MNRLVTSQRPLERREHINREILNGLAAFLPCVSNVPEVIIDWNSAVVEQVWNSPWQTAKYVGMGIVLGVLAATPTTWVAAVGYVGAGTLLGAGASQSGTQLMQAQQATHFSTRNY